MSTVTFSVARNDIKNVVDENGDLSQVAVNVPSFEYNANGTYKGMLVESTSENEIRNSEGGGSTNGVIGSGGVLPTNWATAALNGIGVEVIGTGTEKGIEYVDIKFSGTATASASFSLRFEGGTQITAAQNEIWSGSVYMKYTDQTANPDLVRLGITAFDSVPAQVQSDTETLTLTSTLTRFKNENVELTDATTATVNQSVFFTITNTQAYDFTVRFGLPQLEESPCVTSVIKTTSAAVERLRDDIKNTSATTYVGQTSGTIYAEVQVDQLETTGGYILQAHDATDASNWRLILGNFNPNFNWQLRYGSGNTIAFTSASSTGNHKLALVYTDGDVRAYLDGTQVGSSSTSWGDFTSNQLDTIHVGASSFGGSEFNNWVRAFAFYKRALSDNEAKILTQ